MKKTLSILVAVMMLLGVMAMSVSAQALRDIPRAVTAPTIDGTLNAVEWTNALSISIENADALNWITTDADSKFGPGSSLLFMWDADNLYVGAAMRDLTVSSVQPEAGGLLNAGDGIQLCFYSDIEAGNSDPAGNLFWDFLPWTGADRDPSTAESFEHFNIMDTTPNVKLASAIQDDGYTVEFAIPWSEFAAVYNNGYSTLYKGEAGVEMIMMCVVMDADEAGGQSLAYITDEWCVPATTDVFTLVDKEAGAPVVAVEPEAEAPAAAEAGNDIAPAPSAPKTADTGIVVAAVVMAAAAAVILSKKH